MRISLTEVESLHGGIVAIDDAIRGQFALRSGELRVMSAGSRHYTLVWSGREWEIELDKPESAAPPAEPEPVVVAGSDEYDLGHGRFVDLLSRYRDEISDLRDDAEAADELAVAHKLDEALGGIRRALEAAWQYDVGILPQPKKAEVGAQRYAEWRKRTDELLASPPDWLSR